MSDEMDLFDTVRNTLPYQLGFDEGYKRGLEDAAKLVDYHASICTGRDDRDFLGGIAAAIRAKIQEGR